MHKLLKQQLSLLTIDSKESSIDSERFNTLMQLISKTYTKHDTQLLSSKKPHSKNEVQQTQDENTRLIETVFQEATEGIIIEDKNRKIIRANNAAGRILKIPASALIGKDSDYLSSMITKESEKDIYDAMKTQGFWHGEIEITPPNEKKVHCLLTLDALKNEENELNNIVLMLTDVSEIYQSRSKLQYLATYDTLTKIPNRALLFKQLKKSIASVQRKNIHGMLLFIDIDHFKEFNDNYGHQVGDKVLLSVSEKITSICREEDTLGRLSGDEFLLISEDVNDTNAINSIVNKVQDVFQKPHKVGNLSLNINASIGIALYPDNGTTPEDLINAADQAMYSVKKNGRDNYAFYSKEMSNIANEYYFIHNALKDAIASENFTLNYQPQYNIDTEEITTIEVLLRCAHSRISHITIGRLLTIAEETGIIRDISKMVLNMVCEQRHIWKHLNIALPPFAINFSKKELSDEHLLLTIHNTLAQYKIEPQEIELEITESAILHDNITISDNITRLQQLGHVFSLDDYGTGFSSLSTIKTFKFDKIKIDHSFIKNLSTNQDDRVIVSATIGMTKKLGLKIVAEGVETHEQIMLLKGFGCDMVQGYYYTKPLDKNDMEKLLTR